MEKCNNCGSLNSCSGFDIKIRLEKVKMYSIYNCISCKEEYKKELDLNNSLTKDIVNNLLEVENEKDY